MRLDIRTGKIIADNEDYAIPVNDLQVSNFVGHTIFRVLTDDGQLFMAGIKNDAPLHQQMATGALVVERARQAPPHSGRFIVREGSA